jgi:HlyD family secretion protein
VVLRSQPGLALAGQVARLELLADSVTEERLAQVAFAIPPKGVAVGELAEVTIALPAAPQGLVLPNAALQRQAGQTGVWRLNAASKPEWVPVRVVASGLDGIVRVDNLENAGASLAEGDRVVLHSQKPVLAGMRLQVVETLVPDIHPGAAK